MILKIFLFFLLCKQLFSELVFVIEIFRTGARNNVYDYLKWKDNPSINEITNVGIHQHLILGTQMREKYIETQKFLSENFTEKQFTIHSTDFDRVITSVNSHMLGFFPENHQFLLNASEIYPNIMDFSPNSTELEEVLKNVPNVYPIQVFQEDNDIFLKGLRCPGFQIMISENKENNELLEKINQDYHEVFVKVGKIMGIDNCDLNKLFRVMDGFMTDIFENKNIPSIIDSDLWQKMKFLYNIYWHLNYFYSIESKRFSNTMLFNYILSNFDQKIKNGTDFQNKKFVILGAHDINLIHLMIGLNLTNAECIYSHFHQNLTKEVNCELIYPSFASNILFELHKNDENHEYFVNIAVNGKYRNLCSENNINCTYKEFYQKLSDYKLPSDEFYEACYQEKEHKKFIFNLDYTKKLVIYIISIIETAILLILFIIFFRMKIKKEEKEPLRQLFNIGTAKKPKE